MAPLRYLVSGLGVHAVPRCQWRRRSVRGGAPLPLSHARLSFPRAPLLSSAFAGASDSIASWPAIATINERSWRRRRTKKRWRRTRRRFFLGARESWADGRKRETARGIGGLSTTRDRARARADLSARIYPAKATRRPHRYYFYNTRSLRDPAVGRAQSSPLRVTSASHYEARLPLHVSTHPATETRSSSLLRRLTTRA